MTVANARPHTRQAYPGTHRRYRVLFLADHLGMADGGVHGVTTYLVDVLPALMDAGMEVGTCFLRDEHPAAQSLREHGVEVHFLGSGRLDLLVLRTVDEIVRHEGWNILHCTQFRASVIGRAVARLRRGLGTVIHVHDLTMPPPAVRLMNYLVASEEDVGLCVSNAAREVAESGYYLAPGRVRVVYTGIDATRFRPLAPTEKAAVRRELGIPPAAAVLCLVGRFYPVKGHIAMIRMLRSIVAYRQDCVLLLVGSGPEQAACEKLANETDLMPNVRFVGNRSDPARLMAAADVAVVPSESEGLSRFAIEANLCGLPVVAFACGGVSEVLAQRRCGELVPAGNSGAFVDAVIRALQYPRSRLTVDSCVKSVTERFGLDGHVQLLRDCYETL